MIGRLALLALALAGSGVGTKHDPLAGRVAGKPVECIDLDFVQGPQIVDKRTILYAQNRRRVWRTGPVGACNGLEPFATLIVETYGRRWCRNDRFRTLPAGSRIPFGHCRIDGFTPYDLPAR